MIQVPVQRPVCIETTALGAAYLAGLAVGYWSSKEEVMENWAVSRTFVPEMDEATSKKLIKGWEKAVGRSLKWADTEE